MNAFAQRGLLSLIALLGVATGAQAFNGPFTQFVNVAPGVDLDVDVRWPDTGSPPAAGWPVLFFAHGAGGDKNANSGRASEYADDGYVTLTYTNRPAEDRTPDNFANDIVAMKAWLLADFEAAASVVVPVDTNAFGMTGNSLGGFTTWSGVLLTGAFATAVPFNFAYHNLIDYVVSQGSIERVTGAPVAVEVGGEYPADATDALIEAEMNSIFDNFPLVTIPVQNHIAMLDTRWTGTHALTDYLALTAASQRMIYLGTGGHGTPRTDDVFRDDLRRNWFAHHLKGVSNGVNLDDPIQIALLDTNEHISYPSWPPPGQTSDTLFLGENGRLNVNAPINNPPGDTFENDPGTLTWLSTTPDFGTATLRNQVVRDVLSYDSDPLLADALIVGEPSVTLHVEGTGSRYQLNVHLFDLSPSSERILLAVGTATTDTSPNELTIPLSVTGRRVPAGHRLRLEITNRDDQDVDPTDGYTVGGGTLRFIPFLEFSTNQVFFDVARPSSISLPLVGSAELAFGKAAPTLSIGGLTALAMGLAGVGSGWIHSRRRPPRSSTEQVD